LPHRRADVADGRLEEGKAFFFVKKKQKTFSSAVADSMGDGVRERDRLMTKRRQRSSAVEVC
jgi:hypothetical protein